jgi:hypothetical protein
MKQRKIFKLLIKIALALKHNAHALILSGWISIVFAERLFFDKIVWLRTPIFPNAIFDTGVIFIFLFTWLLILWSLLLRKNQVLTIRKKITSLLNEVLEEVKHSKIIIIAFGILFIAAIFDSIRNNTSIIHVFINWIDLIKKFILEELQVPLLTLIYLGLVSLLLKVLYNFSGSKKEKINTQIKEWILGNFLIAIVWVVYVIVYYFSIWTQIMESEIVESMKYSFLFGFVKDSFIYAFLAACLVNGMYRLGHCVEDLKRNSKWLTLGLFGTVAFIISLTALVLDLKYTDSIKAVGPIEYPYPQYSYLIIGHIYLRDWLLLVPLTIVIFIWLFGKINQADEKEKIIKKKKY